MSLPRGWSSKSITGFRGAWTSVDEIEAQPQRAFQARNVRFLPGRVRTRNGFDTAFETAGPVLGLYNWIAASPGWNHLIYYLRTPTQSLCKLRRISDSAEWTLFSGDNAVWGMQVAEAGGHAYIVEFGPDGNAFGDVHIALSDIGITEGTADLAFAKPMTTLCTISSAGSGTTSIGFHECAYIMESRTGFIGTPGPQPSDTFVPAAFTVTPGNEHLLVTLTAVWPADAAYIHFIMNRADNRDRWYFIPGASFPVTPGISSTIVGEINISDERLADSAEEANEYFNIIHRFQFGGAPILVSNVLTYGKRMVYVSFNKAYISDPGDYQNLSEDRHVVQVPGGRKIISAFPLRSNLYLIGPSWTASVSDNGDFPVTWAAPADVSNAIGSSASHGVEWRTAGDYAWVADRSGLYVFNGQYPTRPISYYNSDIWNRINWGAANVTLTVTDDVVRNRVYVAAPLDESIFSNHLLVWDYSRGLSPETVDFSLDNIVNQPTANQFGAMALVLRQRTTAVEHGNTRVLCLGPAPSGGKVLQELEGSHEDSTGGIIQSVYETGLLLLPGEQKQTLSRFGGVDSLIRGVGPCAILPQGLDRQVALAQINEPLETAISEPLETKFYMTESNVTIRFTCDAALRWFELSSLKLYWKPFSY